MSKMPLEWHKECLINHELSVKKRAEELIRTITHLSVGVKHDMVDLNFKKLQYETAVAKKKDTGYDGEKFMNAQRPKFEPNQEMINKQIGEVFFNECMVEGCVGGCIKKFMDGKMCFDRREEDG